MRIVIAPDSFKGSLSALDVTSAVERGILSVFPQAEIYKVPIADGGEGTVEALTMATGGKILRETVTGPLGEPDDAFWGILGDGETAVIEMAAASGLTLVPEAKRDPRITTTFGTGQLIKAALDRGLRKIIIGIGGSATNDGGAGMIQALGAVFSDTAGRKLPHGGAALANLAAIQLSGLDRRLEESLIWVACDVDNPLCGPKGASAVYGPQKGATPEMIPELDAALEKYAAIAQAVTGKQASGCPGAGAAGGLGAGLLFFTNAKLKPGVEIILETTGFANIVKQADFVITGEGRTDFQTAFGKAPVGVAKIAQQFQIPTICLSGGLGKDHENVLLHGIDGLMSITPQPMTLEECIGSADTLIEQAAARLCRLLLIGMKIQTRKSNKK